MPQRSLATMQRAVVAASFAGTPAAFNNEVAFSIAEPTVNVGIYLLLSFNAPTACVAGCELSTN